MDGLSSAASVIAVGSLAVQLADTAKQLCDFWSSIKDAPENIRAIMTDLELLSSVLAEVALEAQRTSPDASLTAVLHSCNGKLKSLTMLTDDLEPGFSSKSSRIRKWTAFKFVLKSEKLRRFQEVLESLKSTLVLAQQNRHRQLIAFSPQKLSSISLQHSAATVTTFSKDPADTQNHIAVLQAETTRVNKTVEDPLLRFGFAVGSQRAVHHIGKEIGITDHINHAYEKRLTHIPSDTFKPEEGKKVSDVKLLTKRTLRQWNTNTDYFFGTIQTCSTTKQLHSNMSGIEEVDDEDSLYEHKSSLVIRPAAWLVSLGFNSGLRLGLFNSSVRGWQSSLNTFCAVPDDSSIFELSRDGNLSAIRGLFSKGLASVRDTNSHGKTPLYVAAESHHPELCKFLIAAGADKSVRSGDNWIWGKKHSPVLAACYAETKEVPFSTTIDTLRLFTDEMDFVEADGDGWLALSGIADLYCRWEPDIFRISDLLVWVLQLFSPEIRTHLIESSYARILRVILNGGMVARLLLELGPVGAIDAVHVEGGFTALQWTLVWATSHTYCLESELEMILAFDADIHHLGFEPEYSFREETPLSLALYSSWLFRRFTNVLKKRQIDMDEFVLQELREHSPLLNDGWTGQTLRALFEHELESDDEYTDVDFCDECHWVLLSSPGLQVEIAWQYYLEWLKGWYSQTASETINSHEDLVGNISENTILDYAFVGPIPDLDAGDRPEPHKESGNDCSGDSSSGSEPAECERDRECETDRECGKKRECETDQEYETYQEYETGQKCETSKVLAAQSSMHRLLAKLQAWSQESAIDHAERLFGGR